MPGLLQLSWRWGRGQRRLAGAGAGAIPGGPPAAVGAGCSSLSRSVFLSMPQPPNGIKVESSCSGPHTSVFSPSSGSGIDPPQKWHCAASGHAFQLRRPEETAVSDTTISGGPGDFLVGVPLWSLPYSPNTISKVKPWLPFLHRNPDLSPRSLLDTGWVLLPYLRAPFFCCLFS